MIIIFDISIWKWLDIIKFLFNIFYRYFFPWLIRINIFRRIKFGQIYSITPHWRISITYWKRASSIIYRLISYNYIAHFWTWSIRFIKIRSIIFVQVWRSIVWKNWILLCQSPIHNIFNFCPSCFFWFAIKKNYNICIASFFIICW